MQQPSQTNVDTASIAQVEACLPVLLDSILGTYFDAERATRLLSDAAERSSLFVATQGGELVGFYVVADPGVFLVFPYLHLLAVKTSERSKGIGAALIAHFEQQSRNNGDYPFRRKVFLLVAEHNQRALAFYVRSGYKQMARIPDMFGEGDTELLMMKDLGPKPATHIPAQQPTTQQS